MKKYQVLFLVASLLIVHCSFCFACRPLATEDCGVAAKGTWTLESGVTFLTNRDNSGTNTIDECLHYGIWDHLEAAVEVPYLSFVSKDVSESGLGDGLFHLKYNFLSFSDDGGMALKLSYQIKSGDADKGFGSNENDLTTLLVLTKKFGDYTCHFNFGYLFDDEPNGADMDDQIIYNIAAQRSLNDKINVYTEMTSQIPTIVSEDEDNNVERESAIEGLLGMTYAISDYLIWDAGIGCGFNKFSSDSKFTTGLTVNL